MADPFDPISLDAETLALLRRAGIERDELGERLARHEYLALRAELQSPDAFSFRVELPNPTVSAGTFPDPDQPEISFETDLADTLPRLPVPLGRIAWVRQADALPVTGILIERSDARALSQALLSLLSEHHHKPFARLVFLCRTLEPVHVLGRYGFICHYVGSSGPAQMGGVMARRYGMSSIWNLQNGSKAWPEG